MLKQAHDIRSTPSVPITHWQSPASWSEVVVDASTGGVSPASTLPPGPCPAMPPPPGRLNPAAPVVPLTPPAPRSPPKPLVPSPPEPVVPLPLSVVPMSPPNPVVLTPPKPAVPLPSRGVPLLLPVPGPPRVPPLPVGTSDCVLHPAAPTNTPNATSKPNLSRTLNELSETMSPR